MKNYMEKYRADNDQITLTNPHNGRKTVIELWSEPIGQYTVKAGANSDYSYTGFIPNVSDMANMQIAIITHHENGKVFR